eukprot:jgi/Psemu1/314348/fgenesh1_kg.1490_\
MTYEPTKIAVTGANGFIGSNCVLALLESGFVVVAIVRDPSDSSKTDFLMEEATKLGKNKYLTFASGDLLREGSYDNAFAGIWGIVHTAAIPGPGEIANDPNEVIKSALNGTKNVTQSIKKNAATIKRFINISSVAAIYSFDKQPDHIFVDEDWNEWSTVERGDVYGYTKTQIEKAIWDDADLQSSIETIVSLNPSVVLGKAYTRSHAESSSTSYVTNTLVGKPVFNAPMSFVDVRDVAVGVILALTQDREKVAGKRFILTGTSSMNALDLLDFVQISHPEAKGAKKLVNPCLFKTLTWLGENIPSLRKPMGWQEIWKHVDRSLEFDSTQSIRVLGIGQYTSLEDTCRVAADSIQPFLND